MVKVRIFRNEQNRVEGFTVIGHANTAEHGRDIVCAAVSVLTQTALLGIGEYLGREVDYAVSSGNLRMRLLTSPDELSDAIFETMILGLSEIEKINPKGVQLLESRR